jgi:putative endonuclease
LSANNTEPQSTEIAQFISDRALKKARSGRLEGRTDGFAIMNSGAIVCVLQCADGSYYVGSTRNTLEKRMAEHETGLFDGYTARRRPVTLVFNQQFDRMENAIPAERQIKGWRREKKEALIRGDYDALPILVSRSKRAHHAPP